MVEVSALNQHNVIGLEIRGQLWAQPVPLDLLIRTQIDLETGRAAVSDAPSGRT
jgi:type VI secretion system protein ImpF